MSEVLGGIITDQLANVAESAMQGYYSAKEAKKQRDFQEKMYKHRYRYTVADMRAAGLNPILAAQFGGGAAPPGAMGYAPPRSRTSPGESALRAGQLRLLDQQAASAAALARKTQAEGRLAEAQIPGAKLQEAIDSGDLGEAMAWWSRFGGGIGALIGGGTRLLNQIFRRKKAPALRPGRPGESRQNRSNPGNQSYNEWMRRNHGVNPQWR